MSLNREQVGGPKGGTEGSAVGHAYVKRVCVRGKAYFYQAQSYMVNGKRIQRMLRRLSEEEAQQLGSRTERVSQGASQEVSQANACVEYNFAITIRVQRKRFVYIRKLGRTETAVLAFRLPPAVSRVLASMLRWSRPHLA